jgi:hypothetical protein
LRIDFDGGTFSPSIPTSIWHSPLPFVAFILYPAKYLAIFSLGFTFKGALISQVALTTTAGLPWRAFDMAHFIEAIGILEIRAIWPASGQLTLGAQGEFHSLRAMAMKSRLQLYLPASFHSPIFCGVGPHSDHRGAKASCG